MEIADLYSRFLPALDDNDRQTGESTVGVNYQGMGYVLDSGYMQIIHPNETLRVAKHPEVSSPERLGNKWGPEERSKYENLGLRAKIDFMGKVTDEVGSVKQSQREKRRQKKFTQRLRALQKQIR
ncbi:hypothetical protein PG996_006703 [Apiospora saccharicola]|uniref:Uncharacterized protein n=1 Tax=Apiospora saccharicola TaxID=335842 RepID=A0ABR1V8S0_9PEZI